MSAGWLAGLVLFKKTALKTGFIKVMSIFVNITYPA